jgi:hypothetical protein
MTKEPEETQVKTEVAEIKKDEELSDEQLAQAAGGSGIQQLLIGGGADSKQTSGR